MLHLILVKGWEEIKNFDAKELSFIFLKSSKETFTVGEKCIYMYIHIYTHNTYIYMRDLSGASYKGTNPIHIYSEKIYTLSGWKCL